MTQQQSTAQVLNHQQILDKITRMAWQLYEVHQGEKKLLLAGISKRGFTLATAIADQLRMISPLEIELCELFIDKTQVRTSATRLEPALEPNADSCVVVIDDVLNSGATLLYGVKHFLDFPLKRLSTAVLVDRNHKNFPVKADFKGLSLSTSSKEHVEVQIGEAPYSVVVS